ncbi:MAG: carboxylesterase family protein, partial [Planctomycetota bacterium]
MTPKNLAIRGLLILTGSVLSTSVVSRASAGPPGGAAAQSDGAIDLREALVIEPVGRYGRTAVHTDAIEAAIVAGQWSPPTAGQTVTLPDGTSKTWAPATVDGEGWFTQAALRGGYAYVAVEVPRRQVMLLAATGHSMVYVNGELRTGDPYRSGIVRLPVLLNPGSNDLLFQCKRGRLKAHLHTPASPVLLDTRDATLPDLRIGRPLNAWAAVVVINASNEPIDNLVIETGGDGLDTTQSELPAMNPLSMRKVPLRLTGRAPSTTGDQQVTFKLLRRKTDQPQTLATATIKLRVRSAEQSYKVTFRSRIDDSVQYYAVKPATPAGATSRLPALFLSLHGAGVEATGQADAYAAKTWGHIVAPTNRRPFGFDWEDWGRLDAMEVLDHTRQALGTDPQRAYLTGHSMGGHGTWHLAATYPDRFAAIGPSAGWTSFWSYGGTQRYDENKPIEAILRRATAPGDTLALSPNYKHHAVYILHGADDDNVPAEQARNMKSHLAEFHRDYLYHEQAGAGHWWDVSKEPGADCVDWAPLFDLFARRLIPTADSVRHVAFTTANPGVSAWAHWVGIEAQQRMLEPASIDIRCEPHRRRFAGTTRNVARLVLDVQHIAPTAPLSVNLDGQTMEDIPWPAQEPRIWLSRQAEEWSVCPRPSPALKGPHRYGPFKDAFRNRVVFVYGTVGTAEENAWAFTKARYDAETFWYRGNASVDVVADVGLNPAQEPDRNVILYGNADTNAAWKALLPDSPIVVRRGRVRIGQRKLTADHLACLFIRPRPGSPQASIGVVAGTGLVGMRLADRLPYFVSGVA